jgi:DNA-binding transcriptional ArsR family regulator
MEVVVDDDVFRALADPSRRALLDAVNSRGGQSLGELCSGLDMTRQSVSKHLAVLEAANLVTTIRRGREKLHFLNAQPIQSISDRWINQFHAGRIQALGDLKSALEQKAMSNDFVYTSYINSTPERVWEALIEPAFTNQ